MRPPDEDIDNRLPVWSSLQMVFMDTDPTNYYADMVRACRESPYSLAELEAILFNELLPALRFNLASTLGEWRGFNDKGLVELVLERHRFGKRRPLWFRRYTATHWAEIRQRLSERMASD